MADTHVSGQTSAYNPPQLLVAMRTADFHARQSPNTQLWSQRRREQSFRDWVQHMLSIMDGTHGLMPAGREANPGPNIPDQLLFSFQLLSFSFLSVCQMWLANSSSPLFNQIIMRYTVTKLFQFLFRPGPPAFLYSTVSLPPSCPPLPLLFSSNLETGETGQQVKPT